MRRRNWFAWWLNELFRAIRAASPSSHSSRSHRSTRRSSSGKKRKYVKQTGSSIAMNYVGRSFRVIFTLAIFPLVVAASFGNLIYSCVRGIDKLAHVVSRFIKKAIKKAKKMAKKKTSSAKTNYPTNTAITLDKKPHSSVAMSKTSSRKSQKSQASKASSRHAANEKASSHENSAPMKEKASAHAIQTSFSYAAISSATESSSIPSSDPPTETEEQSVHSDPPIAQREVPHSDPTLPKSTPKGEKDRYIHKRLIIAGSYYCDREAVESLTVGTYFDLVAEPENPHDSEAVALIRDGRKIGYVAKSDLPPYTVALSLGRTIYGVITDVIIENGRTRYEYETWFAHKSATE